MTFNPFGYTVNAENTAVQQMCKIIRLYNTSQPPSVVFGSVMMTGFHSQLKARVSLSESMFAYTSSSQYSLPEVRKIRTALSLTYNQAKDFQVFRLTNELPLPLSKQKPTPSSIHCVRKAYTSSSCALKSIWRAEYYSLLFCLRLRHRRENGSPNRAVRCVQAGRRDGAAAVRGEGLPTPCHTLDAEQQGH